MISTLSPTSHWLNLAHKKDKTQNKKRDFETRCLKLKRVNKPKNSVLTHQRLWIVFIESSEETTSMRK